MINKLKRINESANKREIIRKLNELTERVNATSSLRITGAGRSHQTPFGTSIHLKPPKPARQFHIYKVAVHDVPRGLYLCDKLDYYDATNWATGQAPVFKSVSITGASDISFTDANPDTILYDGASDNFGTLGFVKGMRLVISATSNNNVSSYTIDNLEEGKLITLVDADTVTGEADTSAVIKGYYQIFNLAEHATESLVLNVTDLILAWSESDDEDNSRLVGFELMSKGGFLLW